MYIQLFKLPHSEKPTDFYAVSFFTEIRDIHAETFMQLLTQIADFVIRFI